MLFSALEYYPPPLHFTKNCKPFKRSKNDPFSRAKSEVLEHRNSRKKGIFSRFPEPNITPPWVVMNFADEIRKVQKCQNVKYWPWFLNPRNSTETTSLEELLKNCLCRTGKLNLFRPNLEISCCQIFHLWVAEISKIANISANLQDMDMVAKGRL